MFEQVTNFINNLSENENSLLIKKKCSKIINKNIGIILKEILKYTKMRMLTSRVFPSNLFPQKCCQV